MCRVEERIYINADGHRSKFEEAFPCDKSRNGRLCSKVKKRTTEYYPKRGLNTRNESPSSPLNPPTPTSSGAYIVQPVRPSSSGGRPSTRDGQRAIKPEIVIEFGSSKNKSKQYPILSVSSPNQKRTSMGSVGSTEHIIESPGSDVSRPIKTGFPEASLPPQAPIYGHSDGYNAAPTIHPAYHRRHPSSTSSVTGSSRTPSLYVTSDADYDSPTERRNSRYSSAVVHNSVSSGPSATSSTSRGQSRQAVNDYATTIVTPSSHAKETHISHGFLSNDNAELADRSASSHASSAASGQSRRSKDVRPFRKKKEDDRRRQEDLDREVAEALQQDNIKQVRFELGRAEGRAKERAENAYAEKEKLRAVERDEARRRKEKEKDRDYRAPEPRKEKDRDYSAPEQPARKEISKPLAADHGFKRSTGAHRLSLTHAQMEEHARLLAADVAHMQGESEAAEAREREERNALLRQQQQDTSYYNPRTGGMPSGSTQPVARRGSVSRQGSLSTTDPLPMLGRSGSNRHTQVSQPNPPTVNINNQVSGPYGRHSTRTHQPPPVSFPTNFNPRPQSARRNSINARENPFAAPSIRGSGSSIDNPFAPAPAPQVLSPSAPIHQIVSPTATMLQDPWDARTMRESLPSARQSFDGRYTMERRGHDVINHAAAASHNAARQATYTMRGAAEYDEHAVSSGDERTQGHARRW